MGTRGTHLEASQAARAVLQRRVVEVDERRAHRVDKVLCRCGGVGPAAARKFWWPRSAGVSPVPVPARRVRAR